MDAHSLSLSHVQLFAASWTVVDQAPLSMEFSRQEYWNKFPFPPPGDLPDPGMELTSLAPPAFQEDSLPLHHWEAAYSWNLPLLFTWSLDSS